MHGDFQPSDMFLYNVPPPPLIFILALVMTWSGIMVPSRFTVVFFCFFFGFTGSLAFQNYITPMAIYFYFGDKAKSIKMR